MESDTVKSVQSFHLISPDFKNRINFTGLIHTGGEKLTEIHFQNVNLDLKKFISELGKLDLSELQSLILHNIVYSGDLEDFTKLKGLHTPSLKTFEFISFNSNWTNEDVSCEKLKNILFFEDFDTEESTDGSKILNNDVKKVKIVIQNKLWFETNSNYLFCSVNYCDDILKNKFDFNTISLPASRQSLQNPGEILSKFGALKHLEISSTDWDEIEDSVFTLDQLESLLYHAENQKPKYSRVAPVRIKKLNKNLKKLVIFTGIIDLDLDSKGEPVSSTLSSLAFSECKFTPQFLTNLHTHHLVQNVKKLVVHSCEGGLSFGFFDNLFVTESGLDWVYFDTGSLNFMSNTGSLSKPQDAQHDSYEFTKNLWEYCIAQEGTGVISRPKILLGRNKLKGAGGCGWVYRPPFVGETHFLDQKYLSLGLNLEQCSGVKPKYKIVNNILDVTYPPLASINATLRLKCLADLISQVENVERAVLRNATIYSEDLPNFFYGYGFRELKVVELQNVKCTYAHMQSEGDVKCDPDFQPRQYGPVDVADLPLSVKHIYAERTWITNGLPNSSTFPPVDSLTIDGLHPEQVQTLNFEAKQIAIRSKPEEVARVTQETLLPLLRMDIEVILISGFKWEQKSDIADELKEIFFHKSNFEGWEHSFILAKDNSGSGWKAKMLDVSETKGMFDLIKSQHQLLHALDLFAEESKQCDEERECVLETSYSDATEAELVDFELINQPLNYEVLKNLKGSKLRRILIRETSLKLTQFCLALKELNLSHLKEIILHEIDIQADTSEVPVPVPIPTPQLQKFLLSIRISQLKGRGPNEFSTWKEFSPYLFFRKGFAVLKPTNICNCQVDITLLNNGQRILEINHKSHKLVTTLQDICYPILEKEEIHILGLSGPFDNTNIRLHPKLKILDLNIDIDWEQVEAGIKNNSELVELHYRRKNNGTSLPLVYLRALPPSLKTLEFVNTRINFDHFLNHSAKLELDSLSFSGCDFIDPQIGKRLHTYFNPRRIGFYFGFAPDFEMFYNLVKYTDACLIYADQFRPKVYDYGGGDVDQVFSNEMLSDIMHIMKTLDLSKTIRGLFYYIKLEKDGNGEWMAKKLDERTEKLTTGKGLFYDGLV